jgi:hypothetical protein
MELQQAVNWLCIAILLTTAGLVRTWSLLWSLRRWLEQSLTQVGTRVGRLEEVSRVFEVDERIRHDGDVADLLNSLLQYNEAIRAPLHRGDRERRSPPPGEGVA